MKAIKFIYIAVLMLFLFGCEDVLDIEPTDIITPEQLFSDPGGVKVYMANLYFQMPVEDFTFFPRNNNANNWDENGTSVFRYNGSNPNNGGFSQAMHTDNAMHSEFGTGINPRDQWWDQSYMTIRDVNTLIDIVPDLDIFEEEKQALKAEASFIRAYTYFALAKRYGGVPIILNKQGYTPNVDSLIVPRSTEKETWDMILAECDTAAKYLPEAWGAGDERRATKYAALALKSRVALHAASLAKYWSNGTLVGPAVDQGLVGLPESEAVNYYQACVDASEEIMTSNNFELHGAGELDPAVAAENYWMLLAYPSIANKEAIFIKGYTIGAGSNEHTANNYEIWYSPNQEANGWPHPGRMNPTFDLVELFEEYGATPGDTTRFATVVGGDETYTGYEEGKAQTFIQYDTPSQIFENRDARLWGTVILPGTSWKGTDIVIQAGLIKPDGTESLYKSETVSAFGETFYGFGGPNPNTYSGFDAAGGNHTRTGFLFKKFMKTDDLPDYAWNNGTLDYLDMRYSEVLLNYAEAVVEGGFSAKDADAEAALNEVRSRAAHQNTIPLTLDNVLRERRVELCFEHKRYYDLIRRREFHVEFESRLRKSLLPVLDLTGTEAKYIFVRDDVAGQNGKSATPQTWLEHWYYREIPGVGVTGLVQNPNY